MSFGPKIKFTFQLKQVTGVKIGRISSVTGLQKTQPTAHPNNFQGSIYSKGTEKQLYGGWKVIQAKRPGQGQ